MKNEKMAFLVTMFFIAMLMSVRVVLQPGMTSANRHTCLLMMWGVSGLITLTAFALETRREKKASVLVKNKY